MIISTNKDKSGFEIQSDYNKSLLKDWFKKYAHFDLIPRVEESKDARSFLEGAVIPSYCKWQYGIMPNDKNRSEQRRFLFKRDFNYEILVNRKGEPVKSPKSSKALASKILKEFTRYAEENGCPIPNPALYKLYRDKWSSDPRFSCFDEFLKFLDLEVDGMPSTEYLEQKLGKVKTVEYPENNFKDMF